MILNPLFRTSFHHHYSGEWDPVVRGTVVLNCSPAGKKALACRKSALINAPSHHGTPHFTAAAVRRETWVDLELLRGGCVLVRRGSRGLWMTY